MIGAMSDNDDFAASDLRYAELQKTADQFTEPDSALQAFADFANRARGGFGITLFTAGGTISGTIIAREDFFAGLAERLREQGENTGDDLTISVADLFFGTPAEQMREQRENNADDDDAILNGEQLTNYIHLRDAVVYGAMRYTVGFIRVQLSHVTGWTLGTISAD